MLESYGQSHQQEVKEKASEAFLGNIKPKQTECFRAVGRLTRNFGIFFFFRETASFVFQSVKIICQKGIFRDSLSLLKGFT